MHKLKDNRSEIEKSPYLQKHVRDGEEFKRQVLHALCRMYGFNSLEGKKHS